MAKRYEKEIEEILGRSGGPRIVPPQKQSQSLSRLLSLYLSQQMGGLWSPSPGRVMLGGVVLIAAGFVLRVADTALAVPIVILGIVVLLGGYALVVVRSAPPTPGKTGRPPGGTGRFWRGRPIDTAPEGNTDPEDNWWARQKRGPK